MHSERLATAFELSDPMFKFRKPMLYRLPWRQILQPPQPSDNKIESPRECLDPELIDFAIERQTDYSGQDQNNTGLPMSKAL